MEHNETLACALSGPDLAERVRDWSEVTSRARRRHVERGRVVSTYPNDDQLLHTLRRLIAAEADCCPFMEFDVKAGRDEVVVELRVPDELSGVVAGMLYLATQSPVQQGPK